MATYYLLNNVNVGNHLRKAGDILDDAIDGTTLIARIQAAGGATISTGYAGAALLAKAVAIITEHNLRGIEAALIMLAQGIQAAVENGGGGGGGVTNLPTTLVNGGAVAPASPGDLSRLFMVDNTAVRTINLPAAPPDGFFFYIKCMGAASTNPLTINPNGAQLIEGVNAPQIIDKDLAGHMVMARANAWWLTPNNKNTVLP